MGIIKERRQNMTMEHLTTEDFEKYLDDRDYSEEYLIWSEAVQQHLNECGRCQRILQCAITADCIMGEEDRIAGLPLMGREREFREAYLAEKIAEHSQNQRMLQLAEAIKTGRLWNRPVYQEELLRGSGEMRGEKNPEDQLRAQISASVRQSKGKICVDIRCGSPLNFNVILNPESECAEPLLGEAVYDPATGMSSVEFRLKKYYKKYQLYIEPVTEE